MGEQPTDPQVREQILREILRIDAGASGWGASGARAIVTEDWVIVILDDLTLLPNEELLVEHGKHEIVTLVRNQYLRAIQPNLSAAVERATGHTVVGFASADSVEDPRFAVQVFKLK